jgi:hypothetical protein
VRIVPRARARDAVASGLALLASVAPLAAQRPLEKWALMDASGRIVVPFRSYVSPVGDGLVAASNDDNTRYGFMDLQGAWVIQPTFRDATPFHRGRALVKGDAGWMLIDASGAKVADAPGMQGVAWSIAQSWDAEMPGYYAVKGDDGKVGVANAAGELAVPLQHTQFVMTSSGVITMADQAGDAWTLTYYDAASKRKLFGPVPRGDAWGNGVLAYREGLAGAWDATARRFGYVDRTGAWRIKPRYVAVDPFYEGRALVSREKGELAIIDTTGAEIATFKDYTCSSGYRNGLALVGVRDQFPMLVDRAGKAVARLDEKGVQCRLQLWHADGVVFETLAGDTVMKAFDARTGRTAIGTETLRDVSAMRGHYPAAGLFLVRGWGRASAAAPAQASAPAPAAAPSGGGFKGLRRSVDITEFSNLVEPTYHEYYVYRTWIIDGAYQSGMKLVGSMLYGQTVLVRVKDGRGARTMDEILRVAGCAAPPNGRFVAAQVMFPKKRGEDVYEVTKRFYKSAYAQGNLIATNDWTCQWSLLVDID